MPDDERFVVSYTPGKDLLVTWAINDGATGEHPTGTPDCTTPPTHPPATTSTTKAPDGEVTTTTTSTTTTTTPGTTTTAPPAGERTTQEQARYEAKQMLLSIKPQLATLKLDVPGVQLVGTYPLNADGDADVVQVLFSKATVQGLPGTMPDSKKAFVAPPAEAVQCLNPAFDLP